MTRGVLIQARHCGFYRFRNIGQFTTNICIITYRNYIATLKNKYMRIFITLDESASEEEEVSAPSENV